MYAPGATPETTGWPAKVVAFVPLSPAAMPATCVPCSLFSGSNGRPAYFHFGDGGANARATLTLEVVKAVSPFGYPTGMAKPAGERNGCVWSTPSSMTPIFIPWPAVASVGPHSAGAPISCGERASDGRHLRGGQTSP